MLSLSASNSLCHEDECIWHISWSSCGQYMATCSADKTIKIWCFDEEVEGDGMLTNIASLEDAHSRTVRCCEFSPDVELLATASFDGTVIIWECANSNKSAWEQVASLEGHENEVKSVAWNCEGNFLATCGRDKRVWIWERLNESEFECVSVLEGHTQDVKFVKWHPKECNILFSCSYDDSIRVWHEYNDDWYCSSTLEGCGDVDTEGDTNNDTHDKLHANGGHVSTVWGVTTDPTGKYLASCSADCSVILWYEGEKRSEGLPEYHKGGSLKNLHKHPILSIDWNSGGASVDKTCMPYIATGGQDNALIISQVEPNIGDMSPRVISKVSNAHAADINCVRWHPLLTDILATVGDDGCVKLWTFEL